MTRRTRRAYAADRPPERHLAGGGDADARHELQQRGRAAAHLAREPHDLPPTGDQVHRLVGESFSTISPFVSLPSNSKRPPWLSTNV